MRVVSKGRVQNALQKNTNKARPEWIEVHCPNKLRVSHLSNASEVNVGKLSQVYSVVYPTLTSWKNMGQPISSPRSVRR